MSFNIDDERQLIKRTLRVAVVGAESSGTKLMTQLLKDAGADALHASFPYGGGDERHWPTQDIHQYGPDYLVWMTRDWWATVASQCAVPHVDNTQAAWNNIRAAQALIVELSLEYETYQVSYESLVQRPTRVIRNLMDSLGWSMPSKDMIDTIVDANSKWLD